MGLAKKVADSVIITGAKLGLVKLTTEEAEILKHLRMARAGVVLGDNSIGEEFVSTSIAALSQTLPQYQGRFQNYFNHHYQRLKNDDQARLGYWHF